MNPAIPNLAKLRSLKKAPPFPKLIARFSRSILRRQASSTRLPPRKPALAATGEFDPIASKEARACGSITLWGSAMPKSFNMWEDYNSFSAELMNMMFEPLVSLHTTEDREVGILADKWEVSEDGKTFTFHVDPRAKWSDGKSITAEDVQFYYDVIMDEKNLTPIFKVGLSRFERPEVVDSLTVARKSWIA